MANTEDVFREQLPSLFENEIEAGSFSENGPGFSVIVHSNVTSSSAANSWIKEYSTASGTSWRVRYTYPTVERISFRKDWVCDNSAWAQRRKGNIIQDADGCKATLTLSIAVPRSKKKFTRNGKRATILLKAEHNHVTGLDAMRTALDALLASASEKGKSSESDANNLLLCQQAVNAQTDSSQAPSMMEVATSENHCNQKSPMTSPDLFDHPPTSPSPASSHASSASTRTSQMPDTLRPSQPDKYPTEWTTICPQCFQSVTRISQHIKRDCKMKYPNQDDNKLVLLANNTAKQLCANAVSDAHDLLNICKQNSEKARFDLLVSYIQSRGFYIANNMDLRFNDVDRCHADTARKRPRLETRASSNMSSIQNAVPIDSHTAPFIHAPTDCAHFEQFRKLLIYCVPPGYKYSKNKISTMQWDQLMDIDLDDLFRAIESRLVPAQRDGFNVDQNETSGGTLRQNEEAGPSAGNLDDYWDGWNLESYEAVFDEFIQANDIPVTYKYTPIGFGEHSAIIAEIMFTMNRSKSVTILTTGIEIYARAEGKTKQIASAKCALKVVQDLYSKELIEIEPLIRPLSSVAAENAMPEPEMTSDDMLQMMTVKQEIVSEQAEIEH